MTEHPSISPTAAMRQRDQDEEERRELLQWKEEMEARLERLEKEVQVIQRRRGRP